MIHLAKAVSVSDVEPSNQPAHVAVGAFDGIHIGHRRLVETLVHGARREGAESVVVTFDPIPREYFSRLRRPLRLTDATQRRWALQRLGVDRVVELQFDERLRRLDADTFVRELLCRRLAVRRIIVGRDFRFGAGASAGVDELKQYADAAGFECSLFDDVEMLDQRVSSTRIRKLVRSGHIALATRLLGRELEVKWQIRTVQRGRMDAGVQWILKGWTSHCLPGEGRYLAEWRLPHGCSPDLEEVCGLPCMVRIYDTGDRYFRAIIEAGSSALVPVPGETCTLALLERLEPVSTSMQIGEVEYGMDWMEEATTLMTVW
ncbi:MAG: adenylyltransferase/cytidyltransferase family protein [Alicyclobacillus sp.]|nr:adenylyltransferase/cytidyltransferase family protein [Alicyclobacillus sp.]